MTRLDEIKGRWLKNVESRVRVTWDNDEDVARAIVGDCEDVLYLIEQVEALRALASEAVEAFEDARAYTSDYFTEKWGYNEMSADFARRLAALTDKGDEG